MGKIFINCFSEQKSDFFRVPSPLYFSVSSLPLLNGVVSEENAINESKLILNLKKISLMRRDQPYNRTSITMKHDEKRKKKSCLRGMFRKGWKKQPQRHFMRFKHFLSWLIIIEYIFFSKLKVLFPFFIFSCAAKFYTSSVWWLRHSRKHGCSQVPFAFFC